MNLLAAWQPDTTANLKWKILLQTSEKHWNGIYRGAYGPAQLDEKNSYHLGAL